MGKRIISVIVIILALLGFMILLVPDSMDAEIEQNMFQGAISEPKSEEKVIHDLKTHAKEENKNVTRILEALDEDPVVEEPGHPFLEIPLDLTDGEQELLLAVSMAEAEGEDAKGKALVMRVVLNRVIKTGRGIEEVIYSPHQFAVSRMHIKPTEDCYKALAMVIDGWDESQGALYFNSKGYPKYGEPIDMGGENGNYGGHYFSR